MSGQIITGEISIIPVGLHRFASVSVSTDYLPGFMVLGMKEQGREITLELSAGNARMLAGNLLHHAKKIEEAWV